MLLNLPEIPVLQPEFTFGDELKEDEWGIFSLTN
jgi:hypothetical protein